MKKLLTLFLIFIGMYAFSQQECDATFSINDTVFTEGDTVHVEIFHNEFLANYEIDFGNGYTVPDRIGKHAYDDQGIYTVCAYVSYLNCVDTVCLNIRVLPKETCSAAFTMSATQIYVGDTLDVEMHHNDPNSGYVFNFGDGYYFQARRASHAYSQPGVYTVCAYLYDGSCSDTTCQTITVLADTTSQSCDASFWVDQQVTVGEDAWVEVLNPAQGVSYHIDWGDGASGQGASDSHAYNQPGNYTVCVYAYADNCADTSCQTITVLPDSSNEGNCDASFSVDQQVTVGEDAWVEVLDPSQSVSYYIDWGDGASGQGASDSHAYNQPGNYTVCVYAYADNCADTSCQTITVLPDSSNEGNCDASFSVDQQVTVGEDAWVEVLNPAQGVSYYIDWGDGASGQGPSDSHAYNQYGQYVICVYAYNQNCSDTVCQVITVLPDSSNENNCDAQFWSNDWVYAGEMAWVEVLNPNSETSYYIDWGDGSSGQGASDYHTYTTPGDYYICVYAYNENCSDTVCQPIRVLPNDSCDASFTISPSPVYAGDSVTIAIGFNQSPTYYYVDLGDGNTSTQRITTHVYQTPGTYTICASVYFNQCSDEVCQTIEVKAKTPRISGTVFQNNSTPLDNGYVFLYDKNQVLDSVEIQSGDSGFYSFEVQYPGVYYTYAQPTGSVNEDYLIPAYHIQSLFWETADPIYISQAEFSTGNDIYLYSSYGVPGIGKILGRVLKKKSDAIAGVSVLLFKDNMDTPVGFTTTDVNGYYSFENLELGDYIISIEMFKHKDEWVYVTLDEDQPESNGNLHLVGSGEITTSIADIELVSGVSPNPFSDIIRLDGMVSDMDYELTNIAGMTVKQGWISKASGIISTGDLQPGVYLLNLSNNGTQSVIRMVKY